MNASLIPSEDTTTVTSYISSDNTFRIIYSTLLKCSPSDVGYVKGIFSEVFPDNGVLATVYV
jgi:hypothetical protein